MKWIMRWKLFYIVIAALTALLYLYQWYIDIKVPAWQAAIWVAIVFIHELDDYLIMKRENDWS
jgi:hypothetical protein